MLLAAINSFGYRLFFLLHIAAVLVAFAPAFVVPVISSRYKKKGQSMPPELAEMFSQNGKMIHGPALLAVGFFGLGLVGMSSKAFEFSDPWVSVAFLLWFLMLGVVFGFLVPAEKRMATGDASAEKLVAMFGGIMHLLLLLMLIVMIWKPGL